MAKKRHETYFDITTMPYETGGRFYGVFTVKTGDVPPKPYLLPTELLLDPTIQERVGYMWDEARVRPPMMDIDWDRGNLMNRQLTAQYLNPDGSVQLGNEDRYQIYNFKLFDFPDYYIFGDVNGHPHRTTFMLRKDLIGKVKLYKRDRATKGRVQYHLCGPDTLVWAVIDAEDLFAAAEKYDLRALLLHIML